ncbi:mucin-2-like [Olea europaea var. sylvestris]|uniref:mucin-2-like n=1 Tax=Olea europaea var. sylvestris TaxID=158386 RepID=UPI000C1D0DC0|nr:mucin-2-like [Olea europaea var. sylvestris]
MSATTSTVTKSPPPPNSQTNTTISHTNPSTTTVATSMTITTTLPSPTNITTTITQKPTTSNHQYGKSLTADRKRERDNILTPKNPKSTPRVGTNHHLPSFAPVALSAVPELAAGATATEPQPTISNIATVENRGGTHSDGRITTALTFAGPREEGDRTGEEVLLVAVATGNEFRSEAMELEHPEQREREKREVPVWSSQQSKVI